MRTNLKVVIVMFLVMFLCGLAYADSTKIQNPNNGHYYQRIDIHMWWENAKTYCESLGGYLATITSQEENQFVYDNLVVFSSSDACWLGGTDKNIEGNWQWITGEIWDYTNWNLGEPNACGGDENYLWMWGSGKWNDNANNASYCSGSPDYFEVYSLCEWNDNHSICIEDTSGQLDIVGNYGAPDGTTEIAVVINNAPNDVASMGFEVTYDTTILEYSGYSRGDLTGNFDKFECNEIDRGTLRCGGLEYGEEIISAGSSGTLAALQFNVTECTQDQNYPVCALQGLVDDIADPDWTTSGGCFTCGCCHDGEVNGDGKLTPQDALCAFQHYLGITDGPCGSLDECQQDHADVEEPQDPGSKITPADALCIFQKYLGLDSCIDGIDICENP